MNRDGRQSLLDPKIRRSEDPKIRRSTGKYTDSTSFGALNSRFLGPIRDRRFTVLDACARQDPAPNRHESCTKFRR